MKIYLTRHGQTKWNLEGRLQGQLDSSLNETGKSQAIKLGEKLYNTNIDLIISSSLNRALDTAKLIRSDRNIEIIEDENLKEINFGIWQGKTIDEIKENYNKEYNNFWGNAEDYDPNSIAKEDTIGETFESLITRVGLSIDNILRKYKDKDILVVTHGVTLKAIYAYVKSLPVNLFWSGAHMDSTCLSIIEVESDSIKFILEGDMSHLE